MLAPDASCGRQRISICWPLAQQLPCSCLLCSEACHDQQDHHESSSVLSMTVHQRMPPAKKHAWRRLHECVLCQAQSVLLQHERIPCKMLNPDA